MSRLYVAGTISFIRKAKNVMVLDINCKPVEDCLVI
jgi:hypothetical protein